MAPRDALVGAGDAASADAARLDGDATATPDTPPLPDIARREPGGWLVPVTAALVVAALPAFVSPYGQDLVVRIAIYAIFALSLELLVGATGLVSLGHAAFLGIGAYATVLATGSDGKPLLLLVGLAIGAAAAYAVVVGALSLRTRGVYFIMVTLAFAQMAYFVVHDTKAGGGSDGIFLYVKPQLQIAGRTLLDLGERVPFYYTVLAVLAATYAFIALLLRSRFGHALAGIRVNEQRMRAAGFSTTPYKLAAFVIAGALAGLAGFLLAVKDGTVNPELLSWHESGAVLLMLILGGIGSLRGAVIGALAFTLLRELFQSEALLGPLASHWQLTLGLAIIAFVATLPRGLIGVFSGARRRGVAEPPPTSGNGGEPLPTFERGREHLATSERSAEPLPTSKRSGEPLPTSKRSGEPLPTSERSGEPLLSATHLSKRFRGLAAVDDVSIDVVVGEIHAVIGTNGAGKSTLVNLLSGELEPTSGHVRFGGADVTRWSQPRRARAGLGRSYQRTTIWGEFSVVENCRLAAQAQTQKGWHFWQPASRDASGLATAARALDATGLAHAAVSTAATLSHGAKRQLEIAMVLCTAPRALLLDEPLAGMGAEETDRMLGLLAALKTGHAILLIEHDMDAVFRVADRITVMVDGQVIASDVPERIRNDPRVQLAYLGDAHDDPATAVRSPGAGHGADEVHR